MQKIAVVSQFSIFLLHRLVVRPSLCFVSIYFARSSLPFLFLVSFVTPSLRTGEESPWSQTGINPYLPRYMPHLLESRIGSSLPQCDDFRLTHSKIHPFRCSPLTFSTMEIKNLGEEGKARLESNPFFFCPYGVRCTVRLPPRGGIHS